MKLRSHIFVLGMWSGSEKKPARSIFTAFLENCRFLWSAFKCRIVPPRPSLIGDRSIARKNRCRSRKVKTMFEPRNAARNAHSLFHVQKLIELCCQNRVGVRQRSGRPVVCSGPAALKWLQLCPLKTAVIKRAINAWDVGNSDRTQSFP